MGISLKEKADVERAKIHYLDIISGLPSYGAKCFSTNQRDGVERVLLISPRFGLSQIAGVRNSVPQPICNIEHLTRVVVTREDDVTHSVSVYIQPDKLVTFSMEDRDACEFTLVLAGYHKLITGKQLNVEKELDDDDDYPEDNAPPYLSQHSVFPANWSYLPTAHGRMHSMAFLQSPPYQSVNQTTLIGDDQSHCDRNMNSTMSNNNHKVSNGGDDFGLDLHSVMTMEILERVKGKPINGLVETRNEEVLRRVAEMQRMVESSEKYLNEHGELVNEYEIKANGKARWNGSSIDMDSDCESMSSSKVSSNEDAPGVLKHSDSLVLLTESINHDLSGITKGLSLLGSNVPIESSKSHEGTPKAQRRVQGLSQLLNDLHAISNDLSQSESDSESVSTPNSSPIHRNQADRNNHKSFRSSFGLHSPDSSVLGPDSKDTNLKEYLRQLKEASNNETTQDIDLAAKKLTELYGFEIGDDTFIENDPDVIDLTAIPPPQTPDELDAFSIISSAPRGFDDTNGTGLASNDKTDFEKFLAQVVIAPPTQKITPAKELTPEEIMSFIIPPPPGLNDEELRNNETEPNVPIVKDDYPKESLYINSLSTVHTKPVVLEYATVERKGPFSCCAKSKKVEIESPAYTETDESVRPPPRRCEHFNQHPPPERPPKSVELQSKLNSPIRVASNTTRLNGGGTVTLPPRKPNVPPVPTKPIFRNPVPLPKNTHPDQPTNLQQLIVSCSIPIKYTWTYSVIRLTIIL
ncbi:FERM and PDZ domain-containing protein 4 [Pseudolycoriella hygida]|uniref:FERM and PDZ domain-containing protein 4 n=1 Tax=Pseudolycoriella hygida TaxID=35572 RepID=A0A9Q0MNH1_9DIPT|nr:FERM and PDZ domain-containing protein 4 [Pseudolycoriella hygida]